eukprot:6183577-Pleurochrysis_carterae.AAC.1
MVIILYEMINDVCRQKFDALLHKRNRATMRASALSMRAPAPSAQGAGVTRARTRVPVDAAANVFTFGRLPASRLLIAAALTAIAPQTMRPAVAETSMGVFGATCAGFGCNSYGGTDFNGLEGAPEGSLPYSEFLALIKEKRIQSVEFIPPSGDEAYAYVLDASGNGVKRVRIGDGWPIEMANGWSSPTWVVRILKVAG